MSVVNVVASALFLAELDVCSCTASSSGGSTR